MIRRTMDAAFFNRICNLPEVRPGLGGPEGPLDVTAMVQNPANFALQAEHGGFILEALGGGTYHVHSQFASEGRRGTVAAMRAGLDFMFTGTDCMRITSHIPDNNPGAKGLGIKAGFRPWFRRETDGLGPTAVVRIDIEDWIAGNEELEADGKAFHELLERAKADIGSSLPQHPDDCSHDCHVGAAIRMCKRGQAAKGIGLYNRWAQLAGYSQVRLLNDAPVLVDVIDAVCGLNGNEMEVLLCR
jgi:hypothetical protein